MIGVVSYGAGNIGNILRALAFLGHEASLLRTPDDLSEACSLLVLPGVGAFPPAMAALKRTGWDLTLRHWAQWGKPLLGICLGMQLLCEASLEDGLHEGLGLVEGTVAGLEGASRLPHIGWNTISWINLPERFKRIPRCRFCYFVHSYALPPGPDTIGVSKTGSAVFSAAVARGSITGFQFHPERSGREGLFLLAHVIGTLEATP
ncbi:MAG: imidazole glycerol phosphate synthase subunit HisH [Thermovirgaceae bacterium]